MRRTSTSYSKTLRTQSFVSYSMPNSLMRTQSFAMSSLRRTEMTPLNSMLKPNSTMPNSMKRTATS